MQDLSLSRKTLEDIATELRDTQEKLSELLPKLIAAREQLERSRLRAPASGTVVGLAVFTVGGVIEPGKPAMEIVPEGRSLVIQAQVDPADADEVAEGETAQVRFVSVHDRTLPLLHGIVRTMSADSFQDKKSGRSRGARERDEPGAADAGPRQSAARPARRRGAVGAGAHGAGHDFRPARRDLVAVVP
jgi:multidrug resistance efflux pump